MIGCIRWWFDTTCSCSGILCLANSESRRCFACVLVPSVFDFELQTFCRFGFVSVSVVSQSSLDTFRNQCDVMCSIGTSKALWCPHFDIVRGQKASEFRATKAPWNAVDVFHRFPGHPTSRHHPTARLHSSGIRLPPGAPGRRLQMRSTVPLGQH